MDQERPDIDIGTREETRVQIQRNEAAGLLYDW